MLLCVGPGEDPVMIEFEATERMMPGAWPNDYEGGAYHVEGPSLISAAVFYQQYVAREIFKDCPWLRPGSVPAMLTIHLYDDNRRARISGPANIMLR
jgi:hypothetical protein